MRELGAELRRAREQLGLNLDELEARTKIRKRYLMALEDGDWGVLPGDVYARGFVRSYAEAVGLDGRALLLQFSDQAADSQPTGYRRPVHHRDAVTQPGDAQVGEAPGDTTVPSGRDPQGRTPTTDRLSARGGSVKPIPPTFSASTYATRGEYRTKRRDGRNARAVARRTRASRGVAGQIIAVVGILVVLGGGLYLINHAAHRTSGTPTAPTGVFSPPAGSGVTGNNAIAANVYGNSGSGGGTGAGGGGGGLVVSNSGAGANTPGAVNASGGSITGVQVTLKGVSGNQINYTVSTDQTMAVTLSAPSTNLWVMTTGDGSVVDGVGGETLQKGQSKAFNANYRLVFHIGNVPAASFSVNGTAVKLPNVTQTVDIVFTKVRTATTNP